MRKMKKMNVKLIVAVMSFVLLFGGTLGGSLAWLLANTDAVTNTFTTSNIEVKLEETTGNAYKMIPGWTITKNPKAWVVEGSEDCILFVKVAKSENFDAFMTYEIAEGWTKLEEVGYYTVYYREVLSDDMGDENAFGILKDNKVVVKGEVTKEMMTDKDFTEPTLSFTAYAHQLYENSITKFKVADAWINLNSSN